MPDQLSLEGQMRQVLGESRAWRKQLKVISNFVPGKRPDLTVLRGGFKCHSDSLLTFLRMRIIIFFENETSDIFENESINFLESET